MKIPPWQWMALTLMAAVSIASLYRGHQVGEGHKAFVRLGCANCHLSGGGPSLEHVGRKYDRATFIDFVNDPETVYTKLGRKPLNRGYESMPRQQASHHDADVISYFLSAQR